MRRSLSSVIVRRVAASRLLAGGVLGGTALRSFTPGKAAAATKMTLTFYDGGLYAGQ